MINSTKSSITWGDEWIVRRRSSLIGEKNAPPFWIVIAFIVGLFPFILFELILKLIIIFNIFKNNIYRIFLTINGALSPPVNHLIDHL